MTDKIDEWLSHTLKSINDSLPKRMEKFTRLIEMEEPYVETIGGEKHHFNKEELKQIAEKLPDHILANLYLPIVFTKQHNLEESVYIIRARGTEAEAFKILMKINDLPKINNQPYTYKPLIAEFINKYPTLAVIGYL